MSFSTNTLRSRFEAESGPAYVNRWEVKLPLVAGSTPSGDFVDFQPSEPVNELCTQVSLPSKTLATLDRQIGLEPIKVASGYNFGTVSMTFYLTQNYVARKYWQAWMDRIVNPTPPYTVGYRDNYTEEIKISQLDKLGAKKYTVTLEGAYPTAINEIEFNNQQVGAVGELTVTIDFSHYTVS